MSETLKSWIQTRASELGFSAAGVMNPQGVNFYEDLQNYLEEKRHGEMHWMAERMNWRAEPTTLWPAVKSVIVLAESYDAPGSPAPKTAGEISTYARGRDYHDVVKKRLKTLGREIVTQTGCEIKVFVDTAPVMEKPLAEHAGVGWQGKHGNLLSRELGNWFFLGEIFTTLELEADTPAQNHCGSCQSCWEACPTEAFDAQGRLDPRRCISYLTIEHSGIIPEEFRKPLGNLIYGCDICLRACPWNKFEAGAFDERLEAREENIAPPLKALLALDDAAFRARFTASAIKRIGWTQFMRNCLIAAGNAEDKTLLPLIEKFVQSENLMLQETAKWARRQYE